MGLDVTDYGRSKAFYEKALAPLGMKVLMEPAPVICGFGGEFPFFWIGKRDEGPSTGVHVAFTAKDREMVDAFHAAALEAGGTDNGGPGVREIYQRAAATLRRNLEAVGAEAEVRRQDVLRFLASVSGPYDLVFLDPPYDSAFRVAGPLSERLPAVLTQEARIVTESDKRAPLELALPLELERLYGDTRIAIHRA